MWNPFPTAVEPYIGAVFMETFLYGIYAVLFGICMFVLAQRHRRAQSPPPPPFTWGRALHWMLPAWAIAMFALAYADIVYTYFIFFVHLLRGTFGFSVLYPKYVLFVTNTILADTLLLFRCYVVWGYRRRVVVGPALLLLAATVCVYLFEGASIRLFGHSWVYLAMTFAFNVIVTGLTAGRIWYLARRTPHRQRYNTSVAILLESGAIYCVYMILDLAFYHNSAGNAVLDAGLIQVVGIVPTLIIVQVGLGRAVHEVEENGACSDCRTITDGRASRFSMDARSLAARSAHPRHSLQKSGGDAIALQLQPWRSSASYNSGLESDVPKIQISAARSRDSFTPPQSRPSSRASDPVDNLAEGRRSFQQMRSKLAAEYVVEAFVAPSPVTNSPRPAEPGSQLPLPMNALPAISGTADSATPPAPPRASFSTI